LDWSIRIRIFFYCNPSRYNKTMFRYPGMQRRHCDFHIRPQLKSLRRLNLQSGNWDFTIVVRILFQYCDRDKIFCMAGRAANTRQMFGEVHHLDVNRCIGVLNFFWIVCIRFRLRALSVKYGLSFVTFCISVFPSLPA
jgi:hypothetical protein